MKTVYEFNKKNKLIKIRVDRWNWVYSVGDKNLDIKKYNKSCSNWYFRDLSSMLSQLGNMLTREQIKRMNLKGLNKAHNIILNELKDLGERIQAEFRDRKDLALPE